MNILMNSVAIHINPAQDLVGLAARIALRVRETEGSAGGAATWLVCVTSAYARTLPVNGQWPHAAGAAGEAKCLEFLRRADQLVVRGQRYIHYSLVFSPPQAPAGQMP